MDLISQLAGTLGVDTQKAETAAGAVLGTIQKRAPAGALDSFFRSAPEAGDWLKKAGPLLEGLGGGEVKPGAGGKLSGLASKLGGGAAIHTVVGVLEKIGITPAAATKGVPLVLGFVESKVGKAGFEQLTHQVPFLKELASGGGILSSAGAALGGLFKK